MLLDALKFLQMTFEKANERVGKPTSLNLAELPDGVEPFTYDVHGTPVTLERYLPAPIRKRIELDFAEADSFMAYVIEQKTAATRIFATVCNPPNYAIRAIIDYHGTDPKDAAWLSHKATLNLRATEEWATWRYMSRNSFDQGDFAIFLEDHQPEIIEPTGAEILEIASSLHASKEVAFRSSVRLQDGTTKFKCDETIDAKAGFTGELDIPNEFTIRVPVFQGEAPRDIVARFRYSLRNGRLNLRYELVRPEQAERETVDALAKRIMEKTELPVFIMGSSV